MDPLDVECPVCNAGVNAPCRAVWFALANVVHNLRVRKAHEETVHRFMQEVDSWAGD